MGKFYKLSVSTAALTLALCANAAQAAAPAGSLFFQLNPNIDNSGTAFSVFIFGQAGTTGSVSGAGGFNQSFTLDSTGFTTIGLPLDQQLDISAIENKGFQVSANAAVSGYLLNRRDASTDMTFLINGERLGSDYFVAGYNNNISNDQVSVQATADNTQVTFLRPNGTSQQVTLNAGQTYQLSEANMTGYRVTGSAPIAVFSGNRCANVPSGITACDHLVEQMPSINQLSSTYFVAQTPRTGSAGNVLRVTATANDTEVRVNGSVVANLDAGQFYEGRVVGGQQINASSAVLVTQYLIGQSQAGANTDPAMTIVPGADQWLSEYVFAPPLGTANFPTDFISIIMQSADTGTLMIDGVLANGSLFSPISSTAYSYANFDVSDKNGPFSITAASPFQLLLSGFDDFDSYFTYGGAAFAPGASPPVDPVDPPPPPSPTPNVFWDGDGNPDNNNVEGGDGILTAFSPNLTQETGEQNNTLPVQPANIIFQGMPGTVTVDTAEGAIGVAGLRFRVDGYVLTGDEITLLGTGEGNVIVETGGAMSNGEGEGEGESEFNDADITALIEAPLVGSTGVTKIGEGTLVLTGVNTYTGGTVIEEGTVIGNSRTFGTGGIANDGTLIFNQSFDGSFGSGISGEGSLTKTGTGRLIVTGTNTLTGATAVNQGLLQVDGNLGSSVVTVNTGARLGGVGTIGGLVVRSGATVAPGQSIGTMNVTGNALFQTGSTYEVELNGLGQNDRIIATGTGTVQAGATLRVIKLGAQRLNLGTRYTVLTANSGRTGLYTLAGDLRVSQFVSLTQTSDTNNVYLNVAQTRAFSAAGATPNQIAAATGADAAGNGALYTAIAYLQTDAEARAAFDAISGELHPTTRSLAVEDSRFVREAITNRLVDAKGNDRSLWMSGYGSWGDLDGDGNAADARRSIGGFFLGTDVYGSETFTLGVLAGYGQGKINVVARSSTANTEDFHVGAYAGLRLGGFGAKFGVAHMWRDVFTNRIINFTGFNNVIQADYNLKTFQAFADIGKKFTVGSRANIEPFASAAYVRVSTDAFSENGLGGLNVSKASGNFAITNLGARFGIDLPLQGRGIGVTASAAWRHVEGDDLTNPGAMRFTAGPAFSISGTPIAQDAAALSLQVNGALSNGVSLGIGYSGQLAKGLNDHGVRGNVTISF
ncbi:autotransporter domain-containing protein [Polymorphobacter sp.]|uniref:autotransporter domain-containing protein n=1 Tax=Polymorphobacter sp. TaxID=1909290 RepID=UPI003F70EE2A